MTPTSCASTAGACPRRRRRPTSPAGIEIVAGLILILGLATRFAALVLLVEMLVLAATAGRVDGGAELVTAGVLAFFCLILVARGGGGWQLLDVLDPPGGPRPIGPPRQ